MLKDKVIAKLPFQPYFSPDSLNSARRIDLPKVAKDENQGEAFDENDRKNRNEYYDWESHEDREWGVRVKQIRNRSSENAVERVMRLMSHM